MLRWMMLVLLFASGQALAAHASALLGASVQSLRGEPAGEISELIVDVSEGRIAYVVIAGEERFHTVPFRALGKGRVDLRLDGKLARLDSPRDVQFRRAGRLIGMPLVHPHPGGTERIGTIRDFEFDPASGRITRVVVASESGESGFPPGVLRHGRFPPFTYWGGGYVDTEDLDDLGWLRRRPSDERRRLHDHRW